MAPAGISVAEDNYRLHPKFIRDDRFMSDNIPVISLAGERAEGGGRV